MKKDNYTRGRAIPGAGSRRGCLCKDKDTYSQKCCGDALLNQGVGFIGGKGVQE